MGVGLPRVYILQPAPTPIKPIPANPHRLWNPCSSLFPLVYKTHPSHSYNPVCNQLKHQSTALDLTCSVSVNFLSILFSLWNQRQPVLMVRVQHISWSCVFTPVLKYIPLISVTVLLQLDLFHLFSYNRAVLTHGTETNYCWNPAIIK